MCLPAERNLAHRVALTALFGYAISYLPLIGAPWMGFVYRPDVVLFGLLGAVLACSWLVTERRVPVGA